MKIKAVTPCGNLSGWLGVTNKEVVCLEPNKTKETAHVFTYPEFIGMVPELKKAGYELEVFTL